MKHFPAAVDSHPPTFPYAIAFLVLDQVSNDHVEILLFKPTPPIRLGVQVGSVDLCSRVVRRW